MGITFRELVGPLLWKILQCQVQSTFPVCPVRLHVVVERFSPFLWNGFADNVMSWYHNHCLLILKNFHIWEESRQSSSIHALVVNWGNGGFLCSWMSAFTASHSFRVVESLSRVLLFCDPMGCSPPGSSVHGISQARILEWVAVSFSRGSSRPRDWMRVPCIVSLAWQADSLPLSHLGSPIPSGSFLFCPQWWCPNQGRYLIVFTSLFHQNLWGTYNMLTRKYKYCMNRAKKLEAVSINLPT